MCEDQNGVILEQVFPIYLSKNPAPVDMQIMLYFQTCML